ncbi:MAG: gfo/Idh/MocA family oxidoreductase, partial [Thermoguttaceae bacterium]
MPLWYAELCQAEEPATPRKREGLRLALIGCGGQGSGDASNASRFGKIVAVCDVDARHGERAKKDF